MSRSRILLLLPSTTYRSADFLSAAARIGAEVTVATDEPSAVQGLNPDGLVTLDFRDPESAVRKAKDLASRLRFDAVVGVDDDSTVAAAAISRALGLRQSPVASAAAARNKGEMRALLEKAGVPVPRHVVFRRDETDPHSAARRVTYPCVLKPVFLAASRGVIRADDPASFVMAWRRVEAILDDPDVARRGGGEAGKILVEDFVPGREVALEGMLTSGSLRVLALFDKPDPLDGPFFEETIYVTPSRERREIQDAIAATASAGARALGLEEGPIHAELRLSENGPVLIEIAARSIGGLCARTLRFGTGMSLEELILRHALGLPADDNREEEASAVMMIPIPRAGILAGVRGLDEAMAVPGIVEVSITLRPGQRLVPLPEGSRYLGFLFSRGRTPHDAEHALRAAHGRLAIEVEE